MARNDNLAEDMLKPLSPEELKKLEEEEKRLIEKREKEIAQWKLKFSTARSVDSKRALIFKTIVSKVNQVLSQTLAYSLYRGHLWWDGTFFVLDLMVADEKGNYQQLRYKYDPDNPDDIVPPDKRLNKYLTQNGVESVIACVKYILDKLSSYPDPVGELFFDLPEANLPYKSVKEVPSVKEADAIDIYICAWPPSAQDSYSFIDAVEKCGREVAWPWPQ